MMRVGLLWIGAGAVLMAPGFQSAPKPVWVAIACVVIGAVYITAAVVKSVQEQ